MRYQRGNQNQLFDEKQTTQWPREKGQKDKQRSSKYSTETKDRTTQTPLKTWYEFMCSRRVRSFCSTRDTCRVTLVTNAVISHA